MQLDYLAVSGSDNGCSRSSGNREESNEICPMVGSLNNDDEEDWNADEDGRADKFGSVDRASCDLEMLKVEELFQKPNGHLDDEDSESSCSKEQVSFSCEDLSSFTSSSGQFVSEDATTTRQAQIDRDLRIELLEADFCKERVKLADQQQLWIEEKETLLEDLLGKDELIRDLQHKLVAKDATIDSRTDTNPTSYDDGRIQRKGTEKRFKIVNFIGQASSKPTWIASDSQKVQTAMDSLADDKAMIGMPAKKKRQQQLHATSSSRKVEHQEVLSSSTSSNERKKKGWYLTGCSIKKKAEKKRKKKKGGLITSILKPRVRLFPSLEQKELSKAVGNQLLSELTMTEDMFAPCREGVSGYEAIVEARSVDGFEFMESTTACSSLTLSRQDEEEDLLLAALQVVDGSPCSKSHQRRKSWKNKSLSVLQHVLFPNLERHLSQAMGREIIKVLDMTDDMFAPHLDGCEESMMEVRHIQEQTPMITATTTRTSKGSCHTSSGTGAGVIAMMTTMLGNVSISKLIGISNVLEQDLSNAIDDEISTMVDIENVFAPATTLKTNHRSVTYIVPTRAATSSITHARLPAIIRIPMTPSMVLLNATGHVRQRRRPFRSMDCRDVEGTKDDYKDMEDVESDCYPCEDGNYSSSEEVFGEDDYSNWNVQRRQQRRSSLRPTVDSPDDGCKLPQRQPIHSTYEQLERQQLYQYKRQRRYGGDGSGTVGYTSGDGYGWGSSSRNTSIVSSSSTTSGSMTSALHAVAGKFKPSRRNYCRQRDTFHQESQVHLLLD